MASCRRCSAVYILHLLLLHYCCLFFFNDTATTEIYTLSLHDALPIFPSRARLVEWTTRSPCGAVQLRRARVPGHRPRSSPRSEEHTSELQSRPHLVCRLLLEKKKKQSTQSMSILNNTCPTPQEQSLYH